MNTIIIKTEEENRKFQKKCLHLLFKSLLVAFINKKTNQTKIHKLNFVNKYLMDMIEAGTGMPFKHLYLLFFFLCRNKCEGKKVNIYKT